MEHPARRVQGHLLSAVEHQRLFRQRHHLRQRVGDVEHGNAGLLVHGPKPPQDTPPRRQVQRGQWLIEQQHLRRRGQSSGKGDPLALAAREGRRHAVQQRLDLQQLDQGVGHEIAPVLGRVVVAEEDVLAHAEVGEEESVLVHVAHAPLLRGAVDRKEPVLVREEGTFPQLQGAGVRASRSRNAVERRALAAAGWTEDGRNARSQRCVQLQGEVRVALAEVQFQKWFTHSYATARFNSHRCVRSAARAMTSENPMKRTAAASSPVCRLV